MLGAGGAARAAVLALRDGFGLAHVDVVARRPDQAARLVADLQAGLGASLRADACAALAEADVLVNATPVGMDDADLSPCPPDSFRPGQIVYDLVYGTRPTRLLQEAAAAGATTLDGLAMLVGQAAGAFRLWTGEDLPLALATDAARRALRHADA